MSGVVRSLRLATTVIAVAVLVGCSATDTAAPSPSPTPTPTFSAADATFEVADEPIVLDAELRLTAASAVVVSGDRVLVSRGSGGVIAFDLHSGEQAWSVAGFDGADEGGWIDGGSTRSVSLNTSSAAGGVLLVPYQEYCFLPDVVCADVEPGTKETAGVAAISLADRSVVWKTRLDATPSGLAMEPAVADADATGVLVTLKPTLDGAQTTVLLDASDGHVLWRVAGFAGTALTDSTVYAMARDWTNPNEPASTAHDRRDGSVTETYPLGMRDVAHAGPGLVLSDSTAVQSGTYPDIFPLHLHGELGALVQSGYETQNLADTTCPARSEGYFACAVNARTTDTELVTWRSGETAPRTRPAPIRDGAQLWGTAGDVLLLNQNGNIEIARPGDEPPTWLASDRDGNQIGVERPGTAIGGSESVVVTKELRRDGDTVVGLTLKLWPVTRHPG